MTTALEDLKALLTAGRITEAEAQAWLASRYAAPAALPHPLPDDWWKGTPFPKTPAQSLEPVDMTWRPYDLTCTLCGSEGCTC